MKRRQGLGRRKNISSMTGGYRIYGNAVLIATDITFEHNLKRRYLPFESTFSSGSLEISVQLITNKKKYLGGLVGQSETWLIHNYPSGRCLGTSRSQSVCLVRIFRRHSSPDCYRPHHFSGASTTFYICIILYYWYSPQLFLNLHAFHTSSPMTCIVNVEAFNFFAWCELATLKTKVYFETHVYSIFLCLCFSWVLWKRSHFGVRHVICKTVSFLEKQESILFSFSHWKMMTQWPRRTCRGFWSSATNRGKVRHHDLDMSYKQCCCYSQKS